jgi:hypothetical protein
VSTDPFLLFWTAPDEALFPSAVIARVRNVSIALLERERWRQTGPRSVKLGGRVLYRKRDVLDWIEKQEDATTPARPPRANEGREPVQLAVSAEPRRRETLPPHPRGIGRPP